MINRINQRKYLGIFLKLDTWLRINNYTRNSFSKKTTISPESVKRACIGKPIKKRTAFKIYRKTKWQVDNLLIEKVKCES